MFREALLPEVVETFAERGRVTPEAAEATGLPIGLPVICGGGDTALAALALDLAPGRVSIAVNTGGTVCTVSNSARMRPAAGLHTLCYARPDQWLLMQPILVAGEALIWHARVCFGTPELPACVINTLLAEAATAPPGSDGLLFLPTLSSERTDPQGLGAFIGLRPGAHAGVADARSAGGRGVRASRGARDGHRARDRGRDHLLRRRLPQRPLAADPG
jgi:xylulokinase